MSGKISFPFNLPHAKITSREKTFGSSRNKEKIWWDCRGTVDRLGTSAMSVRKGMDLFQVVVGRMHRRRRRVYRGYDGLVQSTNQIGKPRLLADIQ